MKKETLYLWDKIICSNSCNPKSRLFSQRRVSFLCLSPTNNWGLHSVCRVCSPLYHIDVNSMSKVACWHKKNQQQQVKHNIDYQSVIYPRFYVYIYIYDTMKFTVAVSSLMFAAHSSARDVSLWPRQPTIQNQYMFNIIKLNACVSVYFYCLIHIIYPS